MKVIFVIYFMLLNGNGVFGQKCDTTKLLFSKVLNDFSFFWKLDSLGSNGFRACAMELIIKSELDTVDEKRLIDKFGKPNIIKSTEYGREYNYFYFDPKLVPPLPNASNNILYISFEFLPGERFISKKLKWFIEN